MQRWQGLTDVPPGWGRCVVTIGVFDGVHRGHQLIIGCAVERARTSGLPCVVLTFDPHPSEVVRPGSHPPRLTSLHHKAELLAALGVDVLAVVPFTAEFAAQSPAEFAASVLVAALHAQVVVVGENFRFGRRAAGDVAMLSAIGEHRGFRVEAVPLVRDDAVRLSSTSVREHLAVGEVEAAADVLGRPHRVEGPVVRGDGRGRGLGYPTANLALAPYTAVPADGVYAGWLVRASGERLPAAISVGTNPTFDGTQRRVEAFVIDGGPVELLDLYDEHVAVEFTGWLRGMERFDSAAELVEQMGRDVARARATLVPSA